MKERAVMKEVKSRYDQTEKVKPVKLSDVLHVGEKSEYHTWKKELPSVQLKLLQFCFHCHTLITAAASKYLIQLSQNWRF